MEDEWVVGDRSNCRGSVMQRYFIIPWMLWWCS